MSPLFFLGQPVLTKQSWIKWRCCCRVFRPPSSAIVEFSLKSAWKPCARRSPFSRHFNPNVAHFAQTTRRPWLSILASLLDDICFIFVADYAVRSPSVVAPTSTHWPLIFFQETEHCSERVHELRVRTWSRPHSTTQELRVKRQLAPPAEDVNI